MNSFTTSSYSYPNNYIIRESILLGECYFQNTLSLKLVFNGYWFLEVLKFVVPIFNK